MRRGFSPYGLRFQRRNCHPCVLLPPGEYRADVSSNKRSDLLSKNHFANVSWSKTEDHDGQIVLLEQGNGRRVHDLDLQVESIHVVHRRELARSRDEHWIVIVYALHL